MQIIAMSFSGEEMIGFAIGAFGFAWSSCLSLLAAILVWFPKSLGTARRMSWAAIALYPLIILGLLLVGADQSNSAAILVVHLPVAISALVILKVLLAARREGSKQG